MIPVVLILMDYLKSSALVIIMKAPIFKQHHRRAFVVGWKKLNLFLENNTIIIIECKDRWISDLERGATLRFLQILGFQPVDIFC